LHFFTISAGKKCQLVVQWAVDLCGRFGVFGNALCCIRLIPQQDLRFSVLQIGFAAGGRFSASHA
jgi:hypothetical protein